MSFTLKEMLKDRNVGWAGQETTNHNRILAPDLCMFWDLDLSQTVYRYKAWDLVHAREDWDLTFFGGDRSIDVLRHINDILRVHWMRNATAECQTWANPRFYTRDGFWWYAPSGDAPRSACVPFFSEMHIDVRNGRSHGPTYIYTACQYGFRALRWEKRLLAQIEEYATRLRLRSRRTVRFPPSTCGLCKLRDGTSPISEDRVEINVHHLARHLRNATITEELLAWISAEFPDTRTSEDALRSFFHAKMGLVPYEPATW